MKDIRRKRAAVICFGNASEDPRPARLISFLKQRDYEITVFSDAFNPIVNIKHVKLDAQLIRNPVNIIFKIIKAIFYLSRKLFAFNRFRDWLNCILYGYSRLCKKSEVSPFEFVVCHDIYLLDFALQIKKKGETKKVFFDAREFYPRQFETSSTFKFFEMKEMKTQWQNI